MKLIDETFYRQMRKGFLRLAILKFIDDSPAYGYELIKRIQDATEGKWTPSPGSIYPILAELENEGLIGHSMSARRKVYTISPKGKDAIIDVIENLGRMHVELMQLFGDAMFGAVRGHELNNKK